VVAVLIEVKRHSETEAYFAPWIEDLDQDQGCIFHFHGEDVTEFGAAELSLLYTAQTNRWVRRPVGAPPGRRVNVMVRRRAVMPCGGLAAVDDRPDGLLYLVRQDLISARGAAGIARALADRTPYWQRLSAPQSYRQSA
jgi:hypothetical protein